MTCNCRLCKRHVEYVQHIKLLEKANLDSSVEFFEKIYEDLNHTEMDNNVNEAILSGQWPSARQYAERIIKRVDENENG